MTISTDARALENHLGGEDAANYREYQVGLLAPHCGRSLLEVGAGLGELAEAMPRRDRLVLSDTDPICLTALKERFADRPEAAVVPMDLDGEIALDEPVETVMAVNVLEHIEDDVEALRGLARMTVPGGTVVLWVPGYPSLYGDFDRLVGHFRRYTPDSLRPTVEAAGLACELVRPVNLLGGLAWWAAVRVGGQGNASPRLVRMYDKLVVPVTKAVESRVRPPFGQSVLCVARTPA